MDKENGGPLTASQGEMSRRELLELYKKQKQGKAPAAPQKPVVPSMAQPSPASGPAAAKAAPVKARVGAGSGPSAPVASGSKTSVLQARLQVRPHEITSFHRVVCYSHRSAAVWY
jgi:hypothetical protein